MPKNSEALRSHHIKLFDGDYERLQRILAGSRIPASQAIRILIRKFINQTEAKADRHARPVEVSPGEVDVESLTD